MSWVRLINHHWPSSIAFPAEDTGACRRACGLCAAMHCMEGKRSEPSLADPGLCMYMFHAPSPCVGFMACKKLRAE